MSYANQLSIICSGGGLEHYILSCYMLISCQSYVQEADLLDEEIDWWSKYYASVGETTKCKKYLELGLDKLTVSALINKNSHFLFIHL